MKRILFVMMVMLGGCTQPDRSRDLLESQGFTEIEITGYNFLSCGQDDQYSTGFRAKSPTGKQVEGAVCAGLFFKGATIRFD